MAFVSKIIRLEIPALWRLYNTGDLSLVEQSIVLAQIRRRIVSDNEALLQRKLCQMSAGKLTDCYEGLIDPNDFIEDPNYIGCSYPEPPIQEQQPAAYQHQSKMASASGRFAQDIDNLQYKKAGQCYIDRPYER
jgi:hypothetical protein